MGSLGNEKLDVWAALGLRCLRYGPNLRSESATEAELAETPCRTQDLDLAMRSLGTEKPRK